LGTRDDRFATNGVRNSDIHVSDYSEPPYVSLSSSGSFHNGHLRHPGRLSAALAQLERRGVVELCAVVELRAIEATQKICFS